MSLFIVESPIVVNWVRQRFLPAPMIEGRP